MFLSEQLLYLFAKKNIAYEKAKKDFFNILGNVKNPIENPGINLK